MKHFKSYAEVKAAIDQIEALQAAVAGQENELVKSALSEKAAGLMAAFTVRARAPRAAKPPIKAVAGSGKK